VSPAAGQGAGTRLGRFELLRLLGRGAQAEVWQAHDPHLDRDVALKLFDPGADPAAVAEGLREARAVSRLAHPNIVPLFEAVEAGEGGGRAGLVFELVNGQTLAALLRRRGSLAEREAVALMRDVLDALALAHAQGIVHRDLKPSNILIDGFGRPRVMDFGIAARVSEAHDGQLAGSPGYIAPEAVQGAAPDPRMDVYAVGMLLGLLLCGRPLLEERDPMRALARTVDEDRVWPASAPPVDAALRTLVMRAVSRDPTQRPPGAAAFRDALTRWLEPEPLAVEVKDHATFEFLLRRMRQQSDFPALSDAVGRIQRVTQSDRASLQGVTDEILRDVALTHKLLRLVNSAFYRGAAGGAVDTLPRAVAVVGLSGVRSMALSVVLMEHMRDKVHVRRLKEVFLLALMTGTLVECLSRQERLIDEPFLAGLLAQLGRLLAEYYFPDEAQQVRRRTEPAWQRDEDARSVEDRAALEVLGLRYEDLGLGVSRLWALPSGLRQVIQRPAGTPPVRLLTAAPERLRWLVRASDDIAQTLLQRAPQELPGRLAALVERYGPALGWRPEMVDEALAIAQSSLQGLARDLGLDLRPGSRAQRLLSPTAGSATWRAAGPPPVTDSLTRTVPMVREPAVAGPIVVPAVVPAAGDATRLLALEQAVAQAAAQLAADTVNLNGVLRALMTALHGALGLRCTVFALRDARSRMISGRLSVGEGAEAVCAQLRLDLGATGTPDLLVQACREGLDLCLADTRAGHVFARLPGWLQREPRARSALLLPLQLKGAPFALIYGDRPEPGGIALGEREWTLLRTLRNQAVMAFKTAS